MRKIIFSLSTITALTTLLLIFNIAGGDEGETAGGRNNKEQKTEETHSGGWQLQVMPNMGNRLVRDLYFTDSLTGYAVASPESVLDSANILKTTNGGFNWSIKYTSPGRLPRIIFLNSNTGFAGGNFLLKTTNAGENWVEWNWPYGYNISDMHIFNEDTIWFASSLLIGGGVYRTTNGGLNWEKRDSGIPANSYPDKLYFYNSRIGFAYKSGFSNVYKTTNAGQSWNIVFTGGFNRLFFIDSLKGYKANMGFYRTYDGGITWSKDSLPNILGNTFTYKNIQDFVCINKDTIYCSGGWIYFYSGMKYRTSIYKTTNGGLIWGYQIPDTSYQVLELRNIFSYKNKVWSSDMYDNRLIFTDTGGDTTIYVGVNQIGKEVPDEFELYQNYPNPFNLVSNVKFEMLNAGYAKIEIFDVSGKKVKTLLNEKLNTGTYEVRFYSDNLPSGIYYYTLYVNEKIIDTKKAVLIK